jgi:hypothetical protein
MNNKNILGVFIGASFMSVSMAVVSYILTNFGAAFLWQLTVVFFAIYGVINGAVIGTVITTYDFNFIRSTIFGLIFNTILGIILLNFMGSNVDNRFYYTYYASIIIGTFNGAIVSLISRQKQFK